MRRPLPVLLAGLVASALTVTLAGAPGVAHADPDGDRPVTPAGSAAPLDDEAEQAVVALETVEELVSAESAGLAPDPGPDTEGSGREITLALRDLAVAQDDLAPADRRRAAALLARPTSPGGDSYADYSVDEAPVKCSKVVCVHRVASTSDAATADFAGKVLATVSSVRNTLVGAGYRPPRSDIDADDNGGNAKPDVYLADIGGQNVFGYCVPEGSGASDRFDYWSYCVLDNDFSPEEFPNNTPLENMRVTAAHEFFHAVQFGYDATEGSWFLEGTATWVEDELFDGIDDSATYLRYGPMRRPAGSLDARDSSTDLGIYGTWSFFRFLTERDTRAEGGLPVLVRSILRLTDARPGGEDRTALNAVRETLTTSGESFADSFASYAETNRHPRRSYEEGKANKYPNAVLAGRKQISGPKPAYSSSGRFQHLTSRTFRLTPKGGLQSARWRIRLAVDLPPTRRGSVARVTVYRKDGTFAVTRIRLNRAGDRTTSRPFSARSVRAVEVHLVNASTRVTNCYTKYDYPTFDCFGVPTDDGLPYEVRARLFRKG